MPSFAKGGNKRLFNNKIIGILFIYFLIYLIYVCHIVMGGGSLEFVG